MAKQKIRPFLEAEWMKLNFSHCFGIRCVIMFEPQWKLVQFTYQSVLVWAQLIISHFVLESKSQTYSKEILLLQTLFLPIQYFLSHKFAFKLLRWWLSGKVTFLPVELFQTIPSYWAKEYYFQLNNEYGDCAKQSVEIRRSLAWQQSSVASVINFSGL